MDSFLQLLNVRILWDLNDEFCPWKDRGTGESLVKNKLGTHKGLFSCRLLCMTQPPSYHSRYTEA